MAERLFLKMELCPRLLIVDGLARTGKILTSRLVSNFKRVECFQYSPIIEQFPVLATLGLLDEQATVSFLRMAVDVLAYDRMVGRNLNTRIADASSIFKANDFGDYLRRALAAEGTDAVERYLAEQRITCFMTHHVLVHFSFFLRAFPDVRMIHVVRHPVDVVHSSYRRGWGSRYGADPRAFTLTIDGDAGPVPWWASKLKSSYTAMTPMERVVNDVLVLVDLNSEGYRRIEERHRDQVLFLPYEKILAEPAAQMERAARFVDTETPAHFDAVIAREGLAGGKDVPLEDRRAKFRDIRHGASRDSVDKLVAAAERYEARWGLPTFLS